MLDFIMELEDVRQPVCIIWGDRDHWAPADVRDACRTVSARMKTVEVHVFADVQRAHSGRNLEGIRRPIAVFDQGPLPHIV